MTAPLRFPPHRRPAAGLCLLVATALLAGCASTALDEADHLARAGRYEDARRLLDAALRSQPDSAPLRSAHARQTERVMAQLAAQAELALAAGRLDEAELLRRRALAMAPPPGAQTMSTTATGTGTGTTAGTTHARASTTPDGSPWPALDRLQAQLQDARALRQRQQAQREKDAAQADAARQAALAPPPLPAAMAAAFQKPVSLEFREAPLRQVFEVLARSSAINFVFDKDVRGEAKVTVFLRQVSLDEALRVILATQQLDRKLLNDHTVLVYPNTAAKQREHQELVTRSLYLANADVKQAAALVRTMTKTRDLHADERLNALVVRDTPEVVRQIEQLLATIDLAEPEVTLAVEVMEVGTDLVESLGLDWPSQVQVGVPGVSGLVPLSGPGVRASIANPAFIAQLRATTSATNLLANPTIRARNREKAKVQIGSKLPVFTTTTAVNVGTSASVTYLDVGLKLDVEPNVQGDGDVSIKVSLEVTNLLREVSGPGGSLAYNLGTRLTTTALRLKDGETQVLAGLINDEDRRNAAGLPGLSTMPVLGRLFGVQGDTRSKTEIVMLITPRIVRPLLPPGVAATTIASGTEAQPGAAALRLRPAARVGGAPGAGGAGFGSGRAVALPADAPTEPTGDAPADAAAGKPQLRLSATREARVGETVSITLANRSALQVDGELLFDDQALQAASGRGGAPGRAAFALAPGAEAVVALRIKAGTPAQTLTVTPQIASARDEQGRDGDLAVDGQALIQVIAEGAKP